MAKMVLDFLNINSHEVVFSALLSSGILPTVFMVFLLVVVIHLFVQRGTVRKLGDKNGMETAKQEMKINL